MKYPWILFDADGTLWDYDKTEAMALEQAFEQTGQRFEPGYVAEYRQINGRIWLEFEQGLITQDQLRTRRFELLFEALGFEVDLGEFSYRYLDNLANGTDLVVDALAVLERLAERGIGMVLITNGLREVQRRRFARSPIRNHFDDVVISEEVGAAKPDARIFDFAFGKMSHPEKAQVLMVGDSLSSDIRGGNDYGIDTCWFNPHEKPNGKIAATFEIRCLRELLGVVEID